MKKVVRFIFDSILPAIYETISVTIVLALIGVLYIPVLVLCASVIRGALPAVWMPWAIIYLIGVAAVEAFQLFRAVQSYRDGSLTVYAIKQRPDAVMCESVVAVLWPMLLGLIAILIVSWVLYFPLHKLNEWGHK